jgi:hypothetical protein
VGRRGPVGIGQARDIMNLRRFLPKMYMWKKINILNIDNKATFAAKASPNISWNHDLDLLINSYINSTLSAIWLAQMELKNSNKVKLTNNSAIKNALLLIFNNKIELAVCFRWLAWDKEALKLFKLITTPHHEDLSQTRKNVLLLLERAKKNVNSKDFLALILFINSILSFSTLLHSTDAIAFLKSNFIKNVALFMNFPNNIANAILNLNGVFNDFLSRQQKENTKLLLDLLSTQTDVVKKKSNAIFFGFKDFTVNASNSEILNPSLLADAIDVFWNSIILNFDNLKLWNKFSIQIKIRFANGQFRSITKFWAYDPSQKNTLLQNAINYMDVKNMKYDQDENFIQSIIFSWKVITEQDTLLLIKSPSFSSIHIPLLNWINEKFTIPNVFNFESLLNTNVRMSKYEPNTKYIENVLLERENKETLPALLEVVHSTSTGVNFIKAFSMIAGLYLTSWTDAMKPNSKEFLRELPNASITINEEHQILEMMKNDPNQAFMNALPKASSKEISSVRFAAWDMETRANNKLDKNMNPIMDSDGMNQKLLEPISISFYQQYKGFMNKVVEEKLTWFINDFISMFNDDNLSTEQILNGAITEETNISKPSERMLKDFVIWLRNHTLDSNRPLILYAHNAAKFDMQFLLNVLIKYLEPTDAINIIQNKGKLVSVDLLINAKLESKKSKLKISFLDSYQLLPGSLNKLAKQFGVDTKINFDVNNIDQDTDIDRIKLRLLQYNMHDSVILFNIIKKVSKMYLDTFNVNLFKAPTNSSLALRIFRTNYLDKERDKINLTSKEVYDMIKPAYQGGACDVYAPKNPVGTKIYYYDINSLYPAMMANNNLPTGKYYIIMENDMNIFDSKFDASFIKAHVECPENIKVPLLQQIVDGKTIAGAGSWDGVFYIAELREATKLGYTIKPYEAIVFEGRNVFSKYINDVYKMRLTFEKSNPMNWICKQTMNSSYGRFGMSPELSEISILDKEGLNEYNSTNPIEDIKYFGDDKVMVTRTITRNKTIDTENENHNLQISLPIAAAITAHSRIEIHRLKNAAAERGILLYSDTDSLVCSDSLQAELIGKGLGKLKLECTAEKGVFLAPKVYALTGVKDGDKELPDILKAKGIKNMDGLNFEVFERLLNSDEVFISHQPKWFRNIEEGNITIKNLKTVTKITLGKRQNVFNLNNEFVSTNHHIFDGPKVITPLFIKLGLPVLITPTENNETNLISNNENKLISKPILISESTSGVIILPETTDSTSGSGPDKPDKGSGSQIHQIKGFKNPLTHQQLVELMQKIIEIFKKSNMSTDTKAALILRTVKEYGYYTVKTVKGVKAVIKPVQTVQAVVQPVQAVVQPVQELVKPTLYNSLDQFLNESFLDEPDETFDSFDSFDFISEPDSTSVYSTPVDNLNSNWVDTIDFNSNLLDEPSSTEEPMKTQLASKPLEQLASKPLELLDDESIYKLIGRGIPSTEVKPEEPDVLTDQELEILQDLEGLTEAEKRVLRAGTSVDNPSDHYKVYNSKMKFNLLWYNLHTKFKKLAGLVTIYKADEEE